MFPTKGAPHKPSPSRRSESGLMSWSYGHPKESRLLNTERRDMTPKLRHQSRRPWTRTGAVLVQSLPHHRPRNESRSDTSGKNPRKKFESTFNCLPPPYYKSERDEGCPEGGCVKRFEIFRDCVELVLWCRPKTVHSGGVGGVLCPVKVVSGFR